MFVIKLSPQNTSANIFNDSAVCIGPVRVNLFRWYYETFPVSSTQITTPIESDYIELVKWDALKKTNGFKVRGTTVNRKSLEIIFIEIIFSSV